MSKILATTFGGTGGDALSMSLHFDYAASAEVCFAIFLVAVAIQIAAESYRPFLYWGAIAATAIAGTTLSDYFSRMTGLGNLTIASERT